MQIHITARHLKLTPSIRAYVEEKVSKAQRYFNHIVWAQVVVSVEKMTHKAEIVLHAGHQTLRVLCKSADLYAAVDLASDKIDAQLRKYKEKMRDHHARVPQEEPAMPEPEERVRFSVVKQVALRPISREQAVNEMDSLGFNFWMFLDKDSRQVQVIYRRQDDSYGLLQPVKWSER